MECWRKQTSHFPKQNPSLTTENAQTLRRCLSLSHFQTTNHFSWSSKLIYSQCSSKTAKFLSSLSPSFFEPQPRPAITVAKSVIVSSDLLIACCCQVLIV